MIGRRAALVTGATRGIGAAIADLLAAGGWDLTLSARSEVALAAAADRLQTADGGQVTVAAANLAVEADVTRLAEVHAGAYGRTDALVLNAGMGTIGPMATFPLRRLDTLMQVNVRSALQLMQLSLPALGAARDVWGSARVVAVSSLTGVASEPLNAAYGASKAALTSLCQTFNTEHSARGLSATAVCPGYVATDMTAGLADKVALEDMIDAADVAEVVLCMTRLGPRTVVPMVPMSRPGEHVWRV